MTSKKHYEAIAKLFRDRQAYLAGRNCSGSISRSDELDRMAREIAEVFRKDNLSFDVERFLSACK